MGDSRRFSVHQALGDGAVVLLSLSVPVLYEKYQDQVDEKLIPVYKIIRTQCRNFEDLVLKKIPMPSNKEKKMQ